jgi:hypothetical protein
MRALLAVGLTLAVSAAWSVPAHAESVLLDTYWGGDPTGTGDADRIGSTRFEVSKLTVAADGQQLTVRVYTNFVNGSAGDYLGAQLGDLFLSTDGWTANGTGPEYKNDEIGASGHATYEYAVTLDDYTWDYNNSNSGTNINNAGGTATLFSTSGGGNIQATDTFFTNGYRQGQEARFSPSGGNPALATGTWGVGQNSDGWYLQYVISSGTLSNAFYNNQLGVHWAMTCGNDTIAGLVPVPEPATLALVAAGLLVVGVRRRRAKAPTLD